MTASKTDTTTDHPAIPVMPPKMVAAAVLIGVVMDVKWDVDFLPWFIQLPLGLVLFAGGMYLMAWAKAALKKHHTTVFTQKPVHEIVTDGPYRYTRNPIYLGGAAAFLGLAVALDNYWMILILPLLLYVIDRHVIAEEERYLEAKFGPVYTDFHDSAPRWL